MNVRVQERVQSILFLEVKMGDEVLTYSPGDVKEMVVESENGFRTDVFEIMEIRLCHEADQSIFYALLCGARRHLWQKIPASFCRVFYKIPAEADRYND